MAADHTDGTPAMLNQPDGSSDITDLFAWMADATHINLVMDVYPNAMAGNQFSNTVKYIFHTSAKASLITMNATPGLIVCTFTAGTPQTISCWVVDGMNNIIDFVSGNASGTAGVTSASGKIKVFAGLRDDPFFFNLAGFKNAAKTVAGAIRTGPNPAGPITAVDANGCPTLTAAAQTLLVNTLKSNAAGTGPGVDFFQKGTAGSADSPLSGNVLAIVMTIDTSLVSATAASPFVGVWASTNK